MINQFGSRRSSAAPPALAALALALATINGAPTAAEPANGRAAPSRIAQSGLPPIRIEVDADGVYAVTGQMLQDAGWRLAEVDPAKIALSSQGEDVAFALEGGGGSLSTTSRIRFYGQRFRGDRLAARYAGLDTHWASFPGQGPDGSRRPWQPTQDATMFEKYTTTNVYWLTADGRPGRPMTTIDGTPAGGVSPLSAFTTTLKAEESHEWYTHHYTSDDTWFWARVNSAAEVTTTFTIALPGAIGNWAAAGSSSSGSPRDSDRVGLPPGSPRDSDRVGLPPGSPRDSDRVGLPLPAPRLHLELVSRSGRLGHGSAFTWNGSPVGELHWDGKSRGSLDLTLPVTAALAVTNTLGWTTLPGGQPDDLYFDFAEIGYARDFGAAGAPLVITLPRSPAGTDDPPLLQVSELPGETAMVYDITDPWQPIQLSGVTSETVPGHGLTARFKAANRGTWPAAAGIGDTRRLWVGSDVLAARRPRRLVARPDASPMLGALNAEYLVVAPAALLPGGRRLAAFRAQQGLSTAVVDLADLYDAYNFGILHPTAIRNFLAEAFRRWTVKPRYLVLVGDGHWDLRGDQGNDPAAILMPPNLSWVDPWQGEVDSANLLATVADGDAVADLAIGRIPVNSAAELDAVIDKIVAYETAPTQPWQARQLFIADNPDAAGDFDRLSDQAITDWSTGRFEPRRVSLAAYAGRCEAGNDSQCLAATTDIVQAINDGMLVVNYTGHGAPERWTHENIFNNANVPALKNEGRLPLVFSWTCLDGYWVYPGRPGLAETWLRTPRVGAVAVFSSTGLGVASGHDILQHGLYAAMYGPGEHTLGAVTLAAKRALAATGQFPDLIHSYTLFGDPALRLPWDRRPQPDQVVGRIVLPSLFR